MSEGTHIYECEDGKKVPSVTTILKILGSESLMRWANRLGFEHKDYFNELNISARRGTLVHQCIQQIVDKNATKVPISFANGFEERFVVASVDNFNRFIKKFPYETIYTEKPISSSKLGYGGTLDWYVKMADMKLIGDFKTSKSVYLKHLLQIGGYANILREQGEDPDGGFILTVNDQRAGIRFIDKDQLILLGKVFDHLAKYYYILSSELEEFPENKDFREKFELKVDGSK